MLKRIFFLHQQYFMRKQNIQLFVKCDTHIIFKILISKSFHKEIRNKVRFAFYISI